MKTRADISAWFEKNLSYDPSGEKACDKCGRGYTFWIDHKSALVGNLLVFLELAPKHRLVSGPIHDAVYGIIEDTYVTGEAKKDSPILARQIIEMLGWE